MSKNKEKKVIPNYFRFTDFIETDTGLSNYPDSGYVLANLSRLWYILNRLRHGFGHPIFINSAYRCPAVNSHKDVGGVSNSYHLQGRAADIRTLPHFMDDFRKYLLDVKNNHPNLFVEFLDKETFIHIAI